MASALDGGDRCAEWVDPPRPTSPTSHRRPTARRRASLRRSAATAVVAGLAITAPLMTLRAHEEDVVALGPDTPNSSVPTTTGPPNAATPPNAAARVPATTTGGRSVPPLSRDATRSPTSDLPSQSSSDEAAAYEAEVVALTNDQRAAHGCPALHDDSRLRAAAAGHSVDMQARDYFDHNTPDGATPWTRIEAQGYPDPSAENIAKGQPTPQAVVEAWMNSTGHRANILNCSSKAIGVGVQSGPGGPWWTQDFGYS